MPEKYQAAKEALSQCERIDECKDWADKSAALASYAKQSGDETLQHIAMRIRDRAIRRCGELLKEFEKSHGANQNIGDGVDTKVTRKSAARDAGLSERQAVTAIRVANVPEDSFESQVESDKPPTVTALAKQGKKAFSGKPVYERLGMTKAEFQAGMYFRGEMRDYVESMETYDPSLVINGSEPRERETIKRNIKLIAGYHDKLLCKMRE